MPNVDFPFGFRPIKKISDSQLTNEVGDISATNVEIAPGDILDYQSDGFIGRASTSSRTIVGVAAEAKAANSGGTVRYVPAKGHQFVVQADEADIAAQTNLKLNYNFVDTAPSGGRSQMELDSSSGAVTATLPLKAIRLYDGFGQGYTNEFGDKCKVVVEFNECAFSGGSVGI